jgi:hypothetical protein
MRTVALLCVLLVIGCERASDRGSASAPGDARPVAVPVESDAITEQVEPTALPSERRSRTRRDAHPRLSSALSAAVREETLLNDEIPLTFEELHAQYADPRVGERPFVLAEAVHWAEQNRFTPGAGSGPRP